MKKFYSITFMVYTKDLLEEDGGLEKATHDFMTALYKSPVVFNPHFDMSSDIDGI